MTQTLDLANVREFLTRHFIDIFDMEISIFTVILREITNVVIHILFSMAKNPNIPAPIMGTKL